MFVGARHCVASELEVEQLGHYEQLIELQRQIVEIAEQNAAAQRSCELLREQLHREIEAIAGPKRRIHERLREAATGVLGRWLKRTESPSPVKRP